MSYTSRNELPSGTSLKRVLEVIDLLGYRRYRKSLRVPNMVGSYHWYDDNDYRSWNGVELQVYNENGSIAIDTRSTVARSHWDLLHQNKTIRLLRDLFGGHFETDAGRNRYWHPDGSPPSPLESGCYIARWRFENALMKSQIYLSSRKLAGNMAREEPTGLHFIDEINPRLLSNNLLIPFIVAVWEEYFRSTFAAVLKYADRREQVLKKARLSHTQLEQIAINRKPVEQTISECFSFQRPSIIGENFRLLDNRLDLAAAMRKPYKCRKVTLYDQIEGLVEGRNAFVHAGDMDMALYDKELDKVLTDIVAAVDRCYYAIGDRFGFTPLTDY